jgi:LysR family hydrogen peroxide-inducible transcriptional activator
MRYFLAIAEERSFTRAAKRCHVAQSSLSRQIRDVEVRLETRLFDRLPRDIRLTDAGKIFEKEVIVRTAEPRSIQSDAVFCRKSEPLQNGEKD